LDTLLSSDRAESKVVSIHRVIQKKIAQSLMHHHFATVCSRIIRFSPKCSEIDW